ncbi:unnamed protein product [Triticum turgidum subsp. durum]|uniref:Flavonoid 3'-monooxygenase n=1 Tax=Triticum turgidum subsp. durum TaxID=4567 RepID=A0A9R0X9B3_TRITD|nr:unnamed protein product [Triticum turgidum subsp. durum]
MELPQLASFLGVVLATVLFFKAVLRRRRQYNLPPGPKPWPIIGNLNLIGTLPHRSIHALSKQYGPLMQLQFGSFPVVVGSSVEMAKFFLKDYLSTVSLNVITRMVMGKKYLEKEVRDEAGAVITTPEEFKWMIDELFLLNGVLNIGDSIPWLDWMDLQGYIKRMKKLSKMFDRFLEHVVDEHSERRGREGESFVVKDMVDVLLQFASDPGLEVKLNREGVKAFTQDLIAGGTESSAVTVEWALSELLKKPEVLAKATEELDRVVGRGRWVTEKDMLNLPYVDAIVKETMRLHPVAPMLVPRLSREDTSINGYDIPAGTRVLVMVWSIGRDPELWKAPEEFMPERFLGSRLDVKGQDYELLPFGSGRRMCPGYSLGLKVIQVSLANLLHGFTWRLPDGVELSMEEIFGLSTPRKYPLEAVVEPKLPAHLYAEA